ncbi:hypothetical protein DPMN_092511 [Dreissena polymorpha]|uniref:Uncharacterized protein n=1 Tax=Dreissena polymorpha TaxID=45954 RepID=A0A9D4L254_DREPO|nr:hypothetical protein DPMN_092511 [Dreissena polymorpha]
MHALFAKDVVAIPMDAPAQHLETLFEVDTLHTLSLSFQGLRRSLATKRNFC